MRKAIVIGAMALVIAGSGLVFAQQRGRPDVGQRWRPTVEDMRAFADARLAALHAGLELSADQEKNWPAFEQAAKEFSKLRLDRLSAAIAARRSGQLPSDNPADRMHRRAQAMTDAGAALKKLADATGPLYQSLDDGQKHRFAILERMGRRGGGERGRGGEFRGRDGGDRGRPGFNFTPRRTDFAPQDSAPAGQENL
jgi:zinc resistance-associated protein